ncbi:hypothetical protein O1L60_13660 [Streptomyces diastatochromogenes]|nr:hypothetical protein [Streptomyces diastatochromogenes]
MSEIGSQSAMRHAPATETRGFAPATETRGLVPATDADAGAAGAWDLVTVPVRQGLEAVDILRRAAAPPSAPSSTTGPATPSASWCRRAPPPPGTCRAAPVRGPRGAACASRAAGAPRTGGRRAPPGRLAAAPGDTDPVTDPAVLREALGEAARLIEAADGCH